MQGLSVILYSFPSWCLRVDSNHYCIASETTASASWATKTSVAARFELHQLIQFYTDNRATATKIPS